MPCRNGRPNESDTITATPSGERRADPRRPTRRDRAAAAPRWSPPGAFERSTPADAQTSPCRVSQIRRLPRRRTIRTASRSTTSTNRGSSSPPAISTASAPRLDGRPGRARGPRPSRPPSAPPRRRRRPRARPPTPSRPPRSSPAPSSGRPATGVTTRSLMPRARCAPARPARPGPASACRPPRRARRAPRSPARATRPDGRAGTCPRAAPGTRATPSALRSWPSESSSSPSGPFTARPAMIGDTATTSSRRAMTAARMPSTARIGSSEMNGFEGASSDAVGARDRLQHARRRSRTRPVEADRVDARRGAPAHQPVLEGQLALVRQHHGAQAAVGGRQHARRHAQPRGHVGHDRRQRLARAQPLGAHEVQADVAVAEDEPVGAAELARRRPSRARVSSRTPQPSSPTRPDSVYSTVSTSGETCRPQCSRSSPTFAITVTLRRRLGRQHAEREPRAADAAGEDGHPHAGSMPRMAITIDTTTPFGERAARRLRDEGLALAGHGQPGRAAAAEPRVVPVGRRDRAALLAARTRRSCATSRPTRGSRCTSTATTSAATS